MSVAVLSRPHVANRSPIPIFRETPFSPGLCQSRHTLQNGCSQQQWDCARLCLRVFRDESAINVAWSIVTVVNTALRFDALRN